MGLNPSDEDVAEGVYVDPITANRYKWDDEKQEWVNVGPNANFGWDTNGCAAPAPGMTDLMVTPESIDAYLAENPPPPPADEEETNDG